MDLPDTLTEAQALSQLRIIQAGRNTSQQSGRQIPYEELYRGSNAVMETPVERIQRAADEDPLQAEGAAN